MSPMPGGRSPEAECNRVTTSASLGSSGGRSPGSRFASMLLPQPGGPMSST